MVKQYIFTLADCKTNSNIFPVLQQNSPCFSCLEKVRTKFHVFPVLWPLCLRQITSRIVRTVYSRRRMYEMNTYLGLNLPCQTRLSLRVISHVYLHSGRLPVTSHKSQIPSGRPPTDATCKSPIFR